MTNVQVFIEHFTQLNANIAFAAALMIAIPAAAASIGLSMLGSKFLESIARQPEIANNLTTKMFTVAALIDGVAIIAMGLGMVLIFMNPFLSSLEKFIA
jgi:F-type H+-transporting ATPase subunit c